MYYTNITFDNGCGDNMNRFRNDNSYVIFQCPRQKVFV